jgi:hypothetical protein
MELQLLAEDDFKCRVDSSQSFECSSLLLGALTKELKRAGFMPAPSPPFEGLSVDGMRNTVRNFRPVCLHKAVSTSKVESTCDLAHVMKTLLKVHERQYYLNLATSECFYRRT